MEELHLCLKTHSHKYKKMQSFIDLYSRYKTQLNDDVENLIVSENDVLDNDDDEDIEDIDADEMEHLDIDMGGYFEVNEQDFLVFEEYFPNFNSIAHQRDVLTNTEMLILHMLMTDVSVMNVGCSIYSKMKNILKDYYERVEEFLQQNETLVEFQDNSEKEQPIKSFEKKYKQLRQLLHKITEKEILVVEIMTQLRMLQNNGEDENN